MGFSSYGTGLGEVFISRQSEVTASSFPAEFRTAVILRFRVKLEVFNYCRDCSN